uniref:Uncharacterized protein n=1 Tax=Peronospora matthiolae TaxID=2874970 RepID=A0AAV1VL44_9STRA
MSRRLEYNLYTLIYKDSCMKSYHSTNSST